LERDFSREDDRMDCIKEVFDEGANLREIRFHVFRFPHRIGSLAQLIQLSQRDISKEEYLEMKREYYHERSFYDEVILEGLGCETWDDYKRKKRNRKARQLRKERGGYEWTRARKEARKRDEDKCVVTDEAESLLVHHINCDKSDNNLDNLVTIARRLSIAIHNGVRDPHPTTIEHWRRTGKEDLPGKNEERIRILEEYVHWLQSNGYQKACIESIRCEVLRSGMWAKGNNKHLKFSTRGKKAYANYRVAMLEPSGFNSKPVSFQDWYEKRYGRKYGQKYDEVSDFEDL
jgi:hypothetical protein